VSVIPLKHPLMTYLDHYEEVINFRQNHCLAVLVAVVAGAALGGLGCLALTKGVFPLSLGEAGSITAAVAAGVLVSSLAISSILIHYSLKIWEKYEKSDEASCLQALMAPESQGFFDKELKSIDCARFQLAFNRHFPDANWKGMMRYFDVQFFGQAKYPDAVICHVYTTFYSIDSKRFLDLYCEMVIEESLSQACIEFLNKNYFLNALNKMSPEAFLDFLERGHNFEHLLNIASIDSLVKKIKHANQAFWGEVIMLLNRTPTGKAVALLEEMSKQDPNQFFLAYTQVAHMCGAPFRYEVETQCIYKEDVMKAVWDQLYALNPPLFIAKYFELRASAPFVHEERHHNWVINILNGSKFDGWARLLIAIDSLYFQHESDVPLAPIKTFLLDELRKIDKEKLNQAYHAVIFQLGNKFKQFLEDRINNSHD
jgi:hypothetical protein